MGRDCMVAYERVRRNCVFAHDELVIKIALACNTLSAGMATAALEELRIVSGRKGSNGDGGLCKILKVSIKIKCLASIRENIQGAAKKG